MISLIKILIPITFGAICLLLLAFFRSRTVVLKILITNIVSNFVALIMCLMGCISHNSSYLDLAIMYVALSIVGSAGYLATLKPNKK
ncbi:hypothetical protein [Candidatus Sarmatiella mevalonica]|uniref:hypothetical protein n=1 Tax=Candidatus Sarmatiella mevalonica TaxID=2770581 RepID=UPI0019246AE1|nr:hypothetical protein [Candidatus Sarmatiella mevalonica]